MACYHERRRFNFNFRHINGESLCPDLIGPEDPQMTDSEDYEKESSNNIKSESEDDD